MRRTSTVLGSVSDRIRRMITVSAVLSLNTGYVDTAGLLALERLFTAHVMGNFVTFAAKAMGGTSAGISQLLAIPTFCLVVVLVRLLRLRLPRAEPQTLRRVLVLKSALLTVAAGLALRYGPFADGDSGWALATGMTLVTPIGQANMWGGAAGVTARLKSQGYPEVRNLRLGVDGKWKGEVKRDGVSQTITAGPDGTLSSAGKPEAQETSCGPRNVVASLSESTMPPAASVVASSRRALLMPRLLAAGGHQERIHFAGCARSNLGPDVGGFEYALVVAPAAANDAERSTLVRSSRP